MRNLSTWIVIRRLRAPFLVIILTFSIAILGMVLIPGLDDKGEIYHLSFFDAFYFVSYMASTIGFGESPFDFTYQQKLWVSFTIYMTVIGWFYGIGAIVALMQDKTLHKEMAKNKFAKYVYGIREPFVLIFGYNDTTKPLVEKFSQANMQMVVLDKSDKAIEELELENYSPHIPAFAGDVLDAETLEMAGIRKKNCKFAISLFNNDQKNTKIALMCKHLNRKMRLIVRSNSLQNSAFLETIDADFIENPFKIISDRLYLSLKSPHIWLLEMWMNGHIKKLKMREHIPSDCFIIYGNGRMGKAIELGLKKANVKYSFIDARAKPVKEYSPNSLLSNEEEIEKKLIDANAQSASVIIAATRDDFINLAVVTLARKMNPKIYTITRENDLSDARLFKLARINRHYLLENILTNKTYNYLVMPLAHIFINHIVNKSDQWGEDLVKRIVKKAGKEPELCEVCIDDNEAYAAYHELSRGVTITLDVLRRKREDYKKHNPILFLLLKRDEEIFLLPPDDFEIKPHDKMLLIYKEECKEDLEYVLENYYELHYVMHGKEKRPGISGLLGS